MNTAWWERQDPETFLDFNWSHPSREVGTGAAIALARQYGGSLVEVGPGAGVDYSQHFRPCADIHYTGYEPTRRFCDALRVRFPAATWVHGAIADLPAGCADVVYCRAVLEHQPALQPALGQLLAAARHAVVIDWYRPPELYASCDFVDGVPCHTFAVSDVFDVILAAGFAVDQQWVAGNEVWAAKRGTEQAGVAIPASQWRLAETLPEGPAGCTEDTVHGSANQ